MSKEAVDVCMHMSCLCLVTLLGVKGRSNEKHLNILTTAFWPSEVLGHSKMAFHCYMALILR